MISSKYPGGTYAAEVPQHFPALGHGCGGAAAGLADVRHGCGDWP
ncbi:MAG: hypothetical protein ABI134_33670 [Byssovorax sp.]